MKRFTSVLFTLILASSTLGCAVTAHKQADYGCNSSFFLRHKHEKECQERQMAKAMEPAPAAPAQPQPPQRSAWEDERQRLLDRIAELEAREPEKEIIEVEKEVVREVEVPVKGIERYTISADILFDTGKAILKPEGKAKLDEAVQDIQINYPGNRINIEGHTDTDPIVVTDWRSNWELGSARALAVLHYLEDEHGIEGQLMSATTYSYHQPVAGNDTPEGKQENRRAEIVIYAEQ